MPQLLHEQPQNGLAGLKHWRHDLMAGFLVALISTPFSIGIAVASGAPPITGLTSAGFVLPFLGGSFVTISGPAAGLAPALYGSMLALGGGSLATGYPLLLPTIMLAGVLQIGLSKLKAARFSAVFPVPVVEGMLASIGLMIIAKQLPTLLGQKFLAHDFWALLAEAPAKLFHANYTVLGLGLGTLALIYIIAQVGKNNQWVKVLSPQLFAVAIATFIAQAVFHLPAQYLIHIPENPLTQGLTLPDFAGLLSNPRLWLTALTVTLTLTLIDGIETLATIHAIDKIDPFRRKSDPDKTLFAIGVSNICSSIAGGLTIIPGGVKSTANILAGGRTQWANCFNACFLLIFLLCFSQQISLLPLAVLSAVLIFTGFKLCRPHVWKNVWHNGGEQLLLFTFTVLVTLTVDLMWGIMGGVAFAFLINLGMLFQARKSIQGKRTPFAKLVLGLFKNPVSACVLKENTYHIYLSRSLVCFNYIHLVATFKTIPQQADSVVLHITDTVLIIDHTIMDNLAHWMLQFEGETGNHVTLCGLDQMRKLAPSEHSTHMAYQFQ
jgi:carbonic anhydrase